MTENEAFIDLDALDLNYKETTKKKQQKLKESEPNFTTDQFCSELDRNNKSNLKEVLDNFKHYSLNRYVDDIEYMHERCMNLENTSNTMRFRLQQVHEMELFAVRILAEFYTLAANRLNFAHKETNAKMQNHRELYTKLLASLPKEAQKHINAQLGELPRVNALIINNDSLPDHKDKRIRLLAHIHANGGTTMKEMLEARLGYTRKGLESALRSLVDDGRIQVRKEIVGKCSTNRYFAKSLDEVQKLVYLHSNNRS